MIMEVAAPGQPESHDHDVGLGPVWLPGLVGSAAPRAGLSSRRAGPEGAVDV